MKKAILGKKIGMTQVFNADGTVVPVTVIEAGPCEVIQKKSKEKDGYNAVILGFEDVRDKRKNKPELGTFKKANLGAKRYIREFKLDNFDSLNIGSVVTCSIFDEGDLVDVTGISKGHGFSGNVKRWNARRLPMSHGAGPCHREPGGIGACSFPGRVFKNHKLPGQFGHVRVTKENLKVVKVDKDKNVLLIKGSIPGCKNGLVSIVSAKKAKK